MLLGGLLANMGQQAGGGSGGGGSAGGFGDITSHLMRNMLAQQSSDRLMDRQRQLMLTQAGLDPNMSLTEASRRVRDMERAARGVKATTAAAEDAQTLASWTPRQILMAEAAGFPGAAGVADQARAEIHRKTTTDRARELIGQWSEAPYSDSPVPGMSEIRDLLSTLPGEEVEIAPFSNVRNREGELVGGALSYYQDPLNEGVLASTPNLEGARLVSQALNVRDRRQHQDLPPRRDAPTPRAPTGRDPGVLGYAPDLVDAVRKSEGVLLGIDGDIKYTETYNLWKESVELVKIAEDAEKAAGPFGMDSGVGITDNKLLIRLIKSDEKGVLSEGDVTRSKKRSWVESVLAGGYDGLTGRSLTNAEREAVVDVIKSSLDERRKTFARRIESQKGFFEGVSDPDAKKWAKARLDSYLFPEVASVNTGSGFFDNPVEDVPPSQ
jgi:hypothetical protein